HTVRPNVAEREELPHRRADGGCWIERAAGNRSDCEYAGQDRETDRQAVKAVVQSAFRGRAIYNDVGERESKEKLGDERGGDIRNLHRRPAFSNKKHGDERCDYAGGDLSQPVWNDVFHQQFSTDEN